MGMLLRQYHAEPDKGEVTTSEDVAPEPETEAAPEAEPGKNQAAKPAKRNQSAKD